jgi:integration host factor subunit beta
MPSTANFRIADHPAAAGVRGTKEHCDTLFRDATKVRQMTRADLTEEVYQAIEMPRKESDVVVCAIFDGIVRALRSGDKVEIRGFGSFHIRQRRARIGRNPKTGARVEVPPKKIPFFKPSKQQHFLIEG